MRVLGPSLLLPGNDARWLPNVDLPAEGLIWCRHLAPSSVGRDGSHCDSDVRGDVRCRPPFGVGSRHGHPSDFTAQVLQTDSVQIQSLSVALGRSFIYKRPCNGRCGVPERPLMWTSTASTKEGPP